MTKIVRPGVVVMIVALGLGCSRTALEDLDAQSTEDGATESRGAGGGGRGVVQVWAGSGHTCAMLGNSRVKCWGKNDHGQLGLGDTKSRGDDPNEMGGNLPALSLGAGATVVEISAGGVHTCALLASGLVKCWGGNEEGQLGLGDTKSRGDAPGEMGDNLPAIDLGTGKTAVAIAMSSFHVCALLEGGSLKCWGDNDRGQLGLGDGNRRGDQPNEMGDNLPVIDLGTGAKAQAIGLGSVVTCALLEGGSLKCWGGNNTGALGLELTDHGPVGMAPNQMGDNLPTVNLGAGKTVVTLASGSVHNCVQLNDSSVKCWGGNDFGQLGVGHDGDVGDAPGHMGDSLAALDFGAGKTAVAISAGWFHSCVVLKDQTVKCWGDNGEPVGTLPILDTGALGLGDLNNRGDDPKEMGDNLPTVDL